MLRSDTIHVISMLVYVSTPEGIFNSHGMSYQGDVKIQDRFAMISQAHILRGSMIDGTRHIFNIPRISP